ncbi:MAG: DUF1122 family protein [Thermofilaceae archaeon]
MEMLRKALELLPVPQGFSLIVDEKPGRFREEVNIELHLQRCNDRVRLLVAKCFRGRPPHYGRWVEVFAVMEHAELCGHRFRFAGSNLERELLKSLAETLGSGDLLYIEYLYDLETTRALRLGIPPALTRLGFELFLMGFIRLKDWYYPEGFMEGGPKLQGEKMVDEVLKKKHLSSICEETSGSIAFLERLSKEPELQELAEACLKRARIIRESC